MYLKEPRTSCWSEKEKWHYCQQLVLILIAGFHLSSHFFLMAYSAKSNILTYSFMCHILLSASEVEKKKKKELSPVSRSHEHGSWHHRELTQRISPQWLTSLCHLGLELSYSYLVSFKMRCDYLCIKCVASNKVFKIKSW